MSIRDLKRRHLGLIALYSTRYAVRGGTGLVFLLLVLVFGLFAANTLIEQVERLERSTGSTEEAKKQLADIVKVAKPLVEWAVGGREDLPTTSEEARAGRDPWATYLLEEKPALLSAILLILVFGLPLAIATGAFNQYSGDVSTRGIRFLLLRTERANLYFGRFLGMAAFTAFAIAIVLLIVVLYMGFALPYYGWGELLGWGAWGFVALVLLSLPYIAVCGWVSSGVDSPFGSLAICGLVVGGLPLLVLIAGLATDYADYASYLLPWGVQNRLLHFEPAQALLAALACLGYTAAFLALGYRHFSRRDL
jgi:ABC-type transport system involved in multi-copper enzyme maturation permease subunit